MSLSTAVCPACRSGKWKSSNKKLGNVNRSVHFIRVVFPAPWGTTVTAHLLTVLCSDSELVYGILITSSSLEPDASAIRSQRGSRFSDLSRR